MPPTPPAAPSEACALRWDDVDLALSPCSTSVRNLTMTAATQRSESASAQPKSRAACLQQCSAISKAPARCSGGKAKIISVILGSAAEATSRKSSTPALRGITQLLIVLFSISALRVDESAKAPSATVVPKTDTTPENRSERRQVAVMFSDLGLKAIN
jgi:hypothetical protein